MARQIDFERSHVCNACTCHSPYLLHMASTITSMNRPSVCPLLSATSGMTLADLHAYIDCTRSEMCVQWMLNASGMALDDLIASIESACLTQILHNYRIWCNRHLSGLNRCPVRLRALVDYLWHGSPIYMDISMYRCRDVRAWLLHASGMFLANIHGSIESHARYRGCIW